MLYSIKIKNTFQKRPLVNTLIISLILIVGIASCNCKNRSKNQNDKNESNDPENQSDQNVPDKLKLQLVDFIYDHETKKITGKVLNAGKIALKQDQAQLSWQTNHDAITINNTKSGTENIKALQPKQQKNIELTVTIQIDDQESANINSEISIKLKWGDLNEDQHEIKINLILDIIKHLVKQINENIIALSKYLDESQEICLQEIENIQNASKQTKLKEINKLVSNIKENKTQITKLVQKIPQDADIKEQASHIKNVASAAYVAVDRSTTYLNTLTQFPSLFNIFSSSVLGNLPNEANLIDSLKNINLAGKTFTEATNQQNNQEKIAFQQSIQEVDSLLNDHAKP